MRPTSAHDNQSNDSDLGLVDRYWRAANYLSVGQIYLLERPFLRCLSTSSLGCSDIGGPLGPRLHPYPTSIAPSARDLNTRGQIWPLIDS